MDLLSINEGMFYWTLIVFLLLVLVLGKFAWKPLLKSIDEREDRINKSIDDAKQAKEEAEKLLNEHRKMLSESEEKASEVLKKAKEASEKFIAESKDLAKKEANDIIAKARKSIDTEKEAALKELKNEFASLVVQAASKIIKSDIDEAKHKNVIESFISDLKNKN